MGRWVAGYGSSLGSNPDISPKKRKAAKRVANTVYPTHKNIQKIECIVPISSYTYIYRFVSSNILLIFCCCVLYTVLVRAGCILTSGWLAAVVSTFTVQVIS